MHETHIKDLDLNLLVPLHVLLRERSVTQAARHLALSQPATSRALARLRKIFDDPLLVRVGRGMALTPRGQALIDPLDRVLGELTGLVRPAHFDPSAWAGRFRLAMTDYAAALLLPKLMVALREQAPAAAIDIEPWRADSRGRLEEGALDLAIHPVASGPAGLIRKKLWDEQFTCVVWRGHPAAATGLELDRYLALPHARVTVTGLGGGHVNETLATRGLRRTIALTIPSFLAAPLTIVGTDLVLTLPRRIASLSSLDHEQLVSIPAPIELPDFTVHLAWHERRHREAANSWLRELIASLDIDDAR